MSHVTETLPAMPFTRDDVLDIAPMYRALQTDRPVTRARGYTGDDVWLVTGYDEAKALFIDPRLGRSHPNSAAAARVSASPVGEPYGEYDAERAAHSRLRKAATPALSRKRIDEMRPWIRQLVGEYLDRIGVQRPPLDLHAQLCRPLPMEVISELLGLPAQDREHLQQVSDSVSNLEDARKAAAALKELQGYMAALIGEKKRTGTGKDVISELMAAQADGMLTDFELANASALLLVGGQTTTVAQMDVAIVLLLTNPGVAVALRDQPDLAARAVEEIMRFGAPADTGVTRYAVEDIPIAGVTIRAGDAVLLAPAAANRDHRAFADADRFDIHRTPNAHLAFGYGPRVCPGAPLARTVLQEVVTALPRRFPAMALAVDVTGLRLHRELMAGGLFDLPVTW
jgi:cytochrome P450